LAITQQNQQLALQRAVPSGATLQGKQPSASQSEAFPRMSRVLSLFTHTEQLRYFSDLSVPVGERLTADRIAPARPTQLVRLLLSQVYRSHEIPLKLSDDDLKHMIHRLLRSTRLWFSSQVYDLCYSLCLLVCVRTHSNLVKRTRRRRVSCLQGAHSSSA
jgi:hypothetical protein